MTLEHELVSVTLSQNDFSSFISLFKQKLVDWDRSCRSYMEGESRFRTPEYEVAVAMGRAQRQVAFGVIFDAMKKTGLRLDWPELVSEINGESIFSAVFPEELAGDVGAAHAYTLGWVLRQVQGPYYDAVRERL
ncbi:MAG: hypothetical protein AABY01_01865 [Nanoarchaeota archaeon]